MKFLKNLSAIGEHPTSIAALVGLFILIVVLLKIKKIKFNPRMITYIGVALALAIVLKAFRLYRLPQGGSITLGSMVPILLIGFFYGPEVGFLTGLLYGIITLIMNPYVLHPVQVLFDYPLPFMVLGIAGFFKDKKILGSFLAVFARFLCHFISGFVFFGSYAPKGMNPLVYSLLANGTHMGIEGAICIVIIAILPLERLYKIFNTNNSYTNNCN